MKSFDEKYPYIAAWVQDGTIEIGYNDYDDVFLVVRLSLINIGQNQAILPEMRGEVFVHTAEFSRQVSWLLLHRSLNTGLSLLILH